MDNHELLDKLSIKKLNILLKSIDADKISSALQKNISKEILQKELYKRIMEYKDDIIKILPKNIVLNKKMEQDFIETAEKLAYAGVPAPQAAEYIPKKYPQFFMDKSLEKENIDDMNL